MKNTKLNYLLFLIILLSSCIPKNNNTSYEINFNYDGTIVCENIAPHIINTPIKFRINDLQYKGTIINGAPRVINYVWDLNCDANELIFTEEPRLNHTFTKYGLYKVCFKILYYLDKYPDDIKEYTINKNNFSDIISIRPAPRIYLSGTFRSYGTASSNRISALSLNDGEIDTSINFDKGFNNTVTALAKYNNMLYVAGSFSKYGSNYNLSAARLIRLDQNGNKDDNFNGSGSGANSSINSILIDEETNYGDDNPRIYIAGSFTTYNGTPRNRIARLHLDGSLDNNFNPPSEINNTVFSLKIKNNKIYIGGTFEKGILSLVALNGLINSEFNVGSGLSHETANPAIRDIVIDDNNNIYIAGNFNYYKGKAINNIAKLNVNGSLDESFIPENSGTSGNIRALLLQDDKIIVAGNFLSYQNGEIYKEVNNIVRLNLNDGSIDNNFNSNGIGTNDVIRAIYIHDNAIYIGGIFSTYNNINKYYAAKLDLNGNLIDMFDPDNLNASVETILVYNNLLIVGGDIIDASKTGVLANRFLVLNPNGTIDNNFLSAYGFNSEVYDFAFDAQYNIIVVGNFLRYNNYRFNRIVRLKQDGTIDNSFITGSGFNRHVRAVKVDNKQRIIVAGNFTSYNGTELNKIARLNFDGSIDTSFNVGLGEININEIINIEILDNNKILIAGDFTKFNGIDVNRILLLDESGTISTSFNEGYLGASHAIYTLKVFENKIYIGGAFTKFNNIDANRILRLELDGSIDTSFNIGLGATDIVRDIAIDKDGKLIVAGNFRFYNSVSKNFLMRLDKFGNLDDSFNKHNYINNVAYSVSIDPNNNYYIGGAFTQYSQSLINKILKFNKTNTNIDTSFNHTGVDEGTVTKILYY